MILIVPPPVEGVGGFRERSFGKNTVSCTAYATTVQCFEGLTGGGEMTLRRLVLNLTKSAPGP